LNTLTLHSLPTLSFLCPKLEDEEIPNEISRLLRHLSRQNWKQRRVFRKGHSLTKTGTRCYHHASSAHFNRGNPPSFPQVYNM